VTGAAGRALSKFTCGVFGNPVYNPSNTEHVRGLHMTLYFDTMEEKRVPDRFVTMLTRVRHMHDLYLAVRTLRVEAGGYEL